MKRNKIVVILLSIVMLVSTLTASVLAQSTNTDVTYQSHIQNIGWQGAVLEGQVSGTDNQSLGMEAMKVKKPPAKPIQLTISDPTLTLCKVCDGNTTAAVTSGTLVGIKGNDKVTASAVATFDNPSVGTGKTITVVYALDGADAARYVKPVDFTVTNGEITQAPNADQAAPTGLAGIAPTSFGGSDGKITGTTSAMEYKLSSNTTYTAATGAEITGLTAGTYGVRYATKTGFNASPDAVVEVIGLTPSITSVTVMPETATVAQGTTKQLTATVAVEDQAAQTVTWSSSDQKVTVTDTGFVMVALDAPAGDYTITATSTVDGTKKGTSIITVPAPIPVSSIMLNKVEISMAAGETETLTATVLPADEFMRVFYWISDNESVATVNQYGEITALSPGIAGITVTTDGMTAICAVTVTPTPASSVSVGSQVGTMIAQTPGQSATFEVTTENIAPGKTLTLRWVNSMGVEAPLVDQWTGTEITYASDPSLPYATIKLNANPLIVEGTYCFIATLDGIDSPRVEVTVIPVPIAATGVSLNKGTTTIQTGATETLLATVAPANATNQNVAWSSDNAAAIVDNNGMVTGVSAGTAVITATTADGSFTATCTVTVIPVPEVAVTGVSLNKATTTIQTGTTETLLATVAPADATNKNVTWSSDNTAVAIVDNYGMVTGVVEGTAVITATMADGNFTANCTVTVPAPIPVPSIMLNKVETSIAVGETETLTATVLPEDGSMRIFYWASDNESVATVNQYGEITALSPGIAGITVTTDGMTAICAVTVTPAPTS